MKKLVLISLLFIAYSSTSGQVRRDAIWCFGDSVKIDFNQNPPAFDYCATRSRGSACSIADDSGNLLFYAHTAYVPFWQAGYLPLGVVWNKNNEVMENGDGLFAGGWYKEMAIIPDPGNSNRYYLFHTGVTYYNKLYYSIIDLNYNSGLGKITQKNILVDPLGTKGLTDGLISIKHGNGRDWWILFRTIYFDGSLDNTFYKILITPSGISSPLTQNIGASVYTNTLGIYFNHSGNKLAVIDVLGLLEIYDFDRCTGLLSNLITVHGESSGPGTAIQTYYWSAEFSSNDSILYVSTESTSVSYLYQYNLFAPTISSSRTLIDSLVRPGIGGDLKMALNEKIYWAGIYDTGPFPFPYADTTYTPYNMNLSVINEPNRIGQACDFQRYGFYLGGHRTYAGLPLNPNYDMIAKGGSVCDTLGLPNAIDEPDPLNQLKVFPNPASGVIRLSFHNDNSKLAEVRLLDLTGRVVLEEKLISNSVNLDALPEGIYLIQLFLNKQLNSVAKVTILK